MDVLCLQETKRDSFSKADCQVLWGHPDVAWEWQPADNTAGGLLCIWDNKLWSRILNSKYRGWRGLEGGPPKPNFSHWWYDLRSINQHGSMAEVSKRFIWKLGRGDQILF